MRRWQATVFSSILLTARIASAAPEDCPTPAALRYSPSAWAREVILSDRSEAFRYPGSASVNAVVSGYDDIVVRLLSDPVRRKREGADALLAAIQTPDPHMVGLILALGVDPNEVHGGGAGALAYAVTAGENRTICLLADYGVRTSAGIAPSVPLLAALAMGNLDAAQLLRFLGYEPGETERSRLKALASKRGMSALWEGVMQLGRDEQQAIKLCHRLNAVPSAPTRID
ncbi:hypothetical protein ACQKIE_16570 [Luteibacter sp. NPDC031894]|uniref:hypothetical protein n=1 Tax=Luteibacter sp. NPDC031894 TaxID=3390572 RepID=UPI003D0214ED